MVWQYLTKWWDNPSITCITEFTQHRLTVRIQRWRRRDFMYGLPLIIFFGLYCFYYVRVNWSTWYYRFAAYFIVIWVEFAFLFIVYKVFEDVLWIFDKNRGNFDFAIDCFSHYTGTLSCYKTRYVWSAPVQRLKVLYTSPGIVLI